MVGTVKVTNQLQVMSNGIFLPLVLVGDYCDVTCVKRGMQFQCILPELSPGAGALVPKNNCKGNR
jgi:hypothetical protein